MSSTSEYNKMYYARNPEYHRARARRYHQENREARAAYEKAYRQRPEVKERHRKWKEAWRRTIGIPIKFRLSEDEKKKRRAEYLLRYLAENKERVPAAKRKYYRKTRDAHIARVNRRRRQIVGSHTSAQWRARVEYFGWKCYLCGKALTEKTLTRDHVIPLAKGGMDWASNLRPACVKCNKTKHAKRLVSHLF